jgi:putative acetyltransferase
LTFENNTNAYLLAPVEVHTDFQGKGIGQDLIHFGLKTLKNDGVEIVITYGDIHFYSKVGFKQISEELIKAPLPLTYPEGWMAQSLIGDEILPIPGKSYCVEEINNPAYW